MPLYFLHLRDGHDEVIDDEGIDYPDMEAVRQAVVDNARDLVAGQIKTTGLLDFRYRIDAENEAGEVVFSLPFEHAVNIIPPE